MPRPEPDVQATLNAAATKIRRVFDCTFGARRNISILDQQTRAFLLAYAICRAGLVSPRTTVSILGGGFSGMTVAAALAARTTCMINVFERSPSLLANYQRAAFRFVHPRLNMQGSRTFDLGAANESTSLPLLNWSGDYAPQIAAQVLQKFQHYRLKTKIAVHLESEVIELSARRASVAVKYLHVRPGMHLLTEPNKVVSDIVILATGFGQEQESNQTNDTSYWRSGDPASYRENPLRAADARNRERVLIAGNGDSGILELAHYLIPGLKHEELPLLPRKLASGFRSALAEVAAALPYRAIETGDGNGDRSVPGPINWYRGLRERLERNRQLPLEALFEPYARERVRKIYRAIDIQLGSHPVSFRAREDVVLAILKQVDPLLSIGQHRHRAAHALIRLEV